MYLVHMTHDRQLIATPEYSTLFDACAAARVWVRQGRRYRVSDTATVDPRIAMQLSDGSLTGLGYTATVYHEEDQGEPWPGTVRPSPTLGA